MPRGEQVIRQWRILRMLEAARGGLRATEVHAALGGPELVAQRTVFRDLEDLQEVGFGLHKDAEQRWSVVAPSEWRGPVPIRPVELLSLLLVRDLLAPMHGTDLAQGLDSLYDKLSALLTPRGRAFVDELRATQVASFWAPQAAASSVVVSVLEDAIQKQQRVRMRYQSYDGRCTERTVDPHALWFAAGQLYLIAHCHLRADMRIFLTSRVQDAALSDEPFDPVPDFDARKYIAGGFGVWSGEEHDVALLFASPVAHLPLERRYHPTQRVDRDEADGSVRLTFRASGLPAMASWVAGFGGQVRVLEPTLLRDMVREIHLAGLERLGAKPPSRVEPAPAPAQVRFED